MKRQTLSDWAQEYDKEYAKVRELYEEGHFIHMYEDELGEVWVYTEEDADIAPEGEYKHTSNQEIRLNRLSSIFKAILESEIETFRADKMNEMNQYKNLFSGKGSDELCLKSSHLKKAKRIYNKIYSNQ